MTNIANGPDIKPTADSTMPADGTSVTDMANPYPAPSTTDGPGDRNTGNADGTPAAEPADPVAVTAVDPSAAAEADVQTAVPLSDSDRDLAGQIKSSARAAGSSIKEEAGTLKMQAADKARSAADNGKVKAAGALSDIGKFLEDSAARLDEQFGPNYGDFARSAATTVEGYAVGLDNKAIDDLLRDARVFVKANPVIAIGGAAALGFLLTRVVKAGLDD